MLIKNDLRIALIQMACGQDPNENLERAIARVEEAAKVGAGIICLPELFRTQYFCQREDPAYFDLAESIPGPTTEALSRLAKANGTVVIAPIFEKRAPGIYHNSVALIDADGEIRGTYRKMHIPDDPGFQEKFYFTPGDLGYQAFHTQAGCIGTLICWDQWFPEAARMTALKGAGILFYPTAIGWDPEEKETYGEEQIKAWKTIQQGHAIANGVYVAAVNRVGLEKPSGGEGGEGEGIEFWGTSFICDPFGQILEQGSEDSEEILIAEGDPERIEEVRRNWPFLRDRRIDTYQDLTKRLID